jgi:hypothetical protein
MFKTVLAIMLAGLAAGCATTRRAGDDSASAAVSERLQPLGGHWQGVIAETAGWYHQGSAPLDLTIAPDRTWSGTVGKTQASGTARLKGRDLVLSGTAHPATGPSSPSTCV